MKQVVQDLRNGTVSVIEQPVPVVPCGHVLIRSTTSLISAGTEKMLIEFGRSNLVQKALSRPDKVKQALQKVRVDGLGATLQAIRSRLDELHPLGYCNAGVVVERAADVAGFEPGDRVASNGPHAEYVVVPKNLCARIPDAVTDEEACFTVLAAIGLQGVRLLGPALGERVAVMGLGLVGLLAAQWLRAAGCRVLGFDYNAGRVGLAQRLGIEALDLNDTPDPVAHAMRVSGGHGLDGVVLATATKTSEPVTNAARMCRQRGRIVLIGVCELELDRDEFYRKELTFQVSCSYGPGRYDPEYEDKGHDYPIGFVRWTEQRNFEAALEAMAAGRLDVRSLVTDRVAVEDVAKAYDRLSDGGSLGIVLQYPGEAPAVRRTENRAVGRPGRTPSGLLRVGVVGAGRFTRSTLLPVLQRSGVELRGIASESGTSAAEVATKFGFRYSAAGGADVVGDAETDVVFITTPHDTHAGLVVEALSHGKHVFVEKPLGIDEEQLAAVERAYAEHALPRGLRLMCGFNRRFAPLTVKAAALLGPGDGPLSMVYTVNAGALPRGHWAGDPDVGGGRIVGEGCHFIDLLSFLARAPVASVHAVATGTPEDEATIVVRMTNGSTGTLHYFPSGHRSYPKETLEIFAGGRVLVLQNFRSLRGYGVPRFRRLALWSQDKGHRQAVEAFLRAVREGLESPIPFESSTNVTRATFAAVRAARSGEPERCV